MADTRMGRELTCGQNYSKYHALLRQIDDAKPQYGSFNQLANSSLLTKIPERRSIIEQKRSRSELWWEKLPNCQECKNIRPKEHLVMIQAPVWAVPLKNRTMQWPLANTSGLSCSIVSREVKEYQLQRERHSQARINMLCTMTLACSLRPKIQWARCLKVLFYPLATESVQRTWWNRCVWAEMRRIPNVPGNLEQWFFQMSTVIWNGVVQVLLPKITFI